MSEFEEEIRSHPNFPRVWWRYVDDVFTVIRLRFLPKILEWLNSLHPSIQFTFEVEEEGSLPFLDLKLTRKDNDE